MSSQEHCFTWYTWRKGRGGRVRTVCQQHCLWGLNQMWGLLCLFMTACVYIWPQNPLASLMCVTFISKHLIRCTHKQSWIEQYLRHPQKIKKENLISNKFGDVSTEAHIFGLLMNHMLTPVNFLPKVHSFLSYLDCLKQKHQTTIWDVQREKRVNVGRSEEAIKIERF